MVVLFRNLLRLRLESLVAVVYFIRVKNSFAYSQLAHLKSQVKPLMITQHMMRSVFSLYCTM